jgi:hypothetical protein
MEVADSVRETYQHRGCDELVNLDALFTLSEIAVTMIGVSGLVAIFLSKGSLHSADRVRFYVILVLGILAALFGYVPYWVSKHLSEAVLVWRFSSILALVLMVPTLSVPILFFMHPVEALKSATPRPIFLVGLLFPITVVTSLTVNALSWPILANSTLYEIALFFMIGNMTFQFGSLVLFRAPTPVGSSQITEPN